MDTCPYYREQRGKPDAPPCCNHKHSPVDCFASKTAVGQPVLKCGGRLSGCQIPREKQLDLS